MRRTIQVRLFDRKQALGHFCSALIFLAIAISSGFALGFWFGLVFSLLILPMSLSMVATGRVHQRLHGLEAVCSPEAIEAVSAGNVLWRLPWERYGGYRLVKQGVLGVLLHPEKGGVEILDLHGAVCGLLQLNMSNASNSRSHIRLTAELRREIDRRVPEDGTRPGEPEPSWLGKKAEKQPYTVLIVGGVFSAVFMALLWKVLDGYGAEEPPGGWVGWFVQGYRIMWLAVPFCGGILVAAYGFLALAMKSERRRMERRKEILPPYEGPTLGEHRFDLALERKVVFRAGILYKYVQPEAMKEMLRTEMASTLFVGLTGSAMMLVLGGLLLTDPQFPRWLSTPFAVVAVLIFLWMRSRRARCEEIAKSLDDMMVWEEGMMAVIRTEGPRLSFPMPEMHPVKPMQDSIRIRVLKHEGQRYAYDPTHMFPADEAV